MIQAIIPIIGNIIGNVLDKSIEDKDERARMQGLITAQLMKYEQAELESAMKVIVAEASSGSWIAQNWRPITMLTFVGLIVAHWLGYTPSNMPEAQVIALLDIVKIGLGGYVLGRSGEKIMKAYKE